MSPSKKVGSTVQLRNFVARTSGSHYAIERADLLALLDQVDTATKTKLSLKKVIEAIDAWDKASYDHERLGSHRSLRRKAKADCEVDEAVEAARKLIQ